MQAFEGIRVLDFTHVLAGPFCAYQLAVMGADVIKIEDPNDPDMMRPESTSAALRAEGRGTRFACQAGNKRSITVDLKTDAGREIILKLAETADVVISNYRAGVMERLGVGADALQAVNPQLIYCVMSGYGNTGPKANHPAYDNVIQAYSGLLKSTGKPESGPVKIGPPVLDYGTGAQAAFAIASALFQRTRTGKGQRIDVSMLDAALMLMTCDVADTHVRDEALPLHGNSSSFKPGYGLFETADGDLMIGAFTPKQLQRTWRLLERDDLADSMEGQSLDEMHARIDEFRSAFEEVFPSRSADEWETLLNDGGIPAARVRDLHETMGSEQVRSRPVLQPGVHVPERDEALATPVACFTYDEGGPELTREAPFLGADTDDVLSEIGMDNNEIANLRATGVI